MTPEELVHRRVEAINTKDFEALSHVLSPDVLGIRISPLTDSNR
jgi:hypothetical protein